MFANPDRSQNEVTDHVGASALHLMRACHQQQQQLKPRAATGGPPASHGVVETWNSSSAAQQAPGKVISEFLDEVCSCDADRCGPVAGDSCGQWQWPLGLELSQAGPPGLDGLRCLRACAVVGPHFAPIASTPQTPDGQVWGINCESRIRWESWVLMGARPETGQGASCCPRSAPRGEFSSGAPIPRWACTLRCTLHIHRGFASGHAKPLDGRARSALCALHAPRHDILIDSLFPFPYRQLQDQQHPSPVADAACLTAGKARNAKSSPWHVLLPGPRPVRPTHPAGHSSLALGPGPLVVVWPHVISLFWLQLVLPALFRSLVRIPSAAGWNDGQTCEYGRLQRQANSR